MPPFIRKVAFQGEPGANSEIAVRAFLPDADPLPCKTFEDCFAALEKGVADHAMIPVENSVAGRVADIHHILPTENVYIVGEQFLPIKHQLMAVPGATVEGLRTVQSHVQALGQCRRTIHSLGLTPIVGADTAGSARQIAEAKDPARAAIASRLAAEIYGLHILAEDIEDDDRNVTRFLVISRRNVKVPHGEGPTITTIVFRVRNVPAALYKALGGFATNGVNMTKLESYQIGGTFFATQFLADVEGHPDDPSVALALEELAFFSAELRVLGVYPAAPFRERIREPEENRALRPSPDI